ncbi:hypothetical protein ACFOYU_12045, partial [Microvirga sp. GCM10011540]
MIQGGIDFLFGDDIYRGEQGTHVGSIDLGEGNDTIYGGVGTERIIAGYGDDVIDGGGGDDELILLTNVEHTIDLRISTPQITGQGLDRILNIENLTGNIRGDTFTGNASDNTFTGKGGNDVLDGGGGVNTAVFSGNKADYTITNSNGTVTVKDNRASQDGEDTLTNIRFARFEAENKTVALINSAPISLALSGAAVAENAADA